MARARRSKGHAKRPKINVGDFVLCGGTRASYPGDWHLGEVLWAADGDLLIGRSTLNGDRWRQVVTIEEVRARGTIAELARIQAAAREEVQQLRAVIAECEQALGTARNRLFARLDEMAAEGLAIIPPDFEAIERREAEVRAIVNQADEERAEAAP